MHWPSCRMVLRKRAAGGPIRMAKQTEEGRPDDYARVIAQSRYRGRGRKPEAPLETPKEFRGQCCAVLRLVA